MSFVSWQFALFFAAVLAGLKLMPTRSSRQLLLLVANAIFYGSGTTWHLLVLGAPALVDYACAVRIEDAPDERDRKRWLLVSLVTNLGLLAYFKYANFFADNIAAVFGTSAARLDVALPVGISFFLFKTMSYTIDVYRREIPACRSLWRYAMFVSFFPELVAGPIVRASVFLPQMERTLALSWQRAAAGLQIVLLGISKKLLVADRLATFVDPVFASPAAYTQSTVICAVMAYSLQIYCDFSGYSDIAIGVARIIGFDLPENFDMPYLATSITDFWRRWHMTLSQWLRDYLYIPLGGNRRGEWRTYVNLMLTMLLGGLWHGASWTFVLWGMLHGVALAAHKLFRRGAGNDPGRRSPAITVASWLVTYAFVCVAWVFFRASDFATAALVLRKIVGLAPGGATWLYLPFWILVPIVAAAHVLGAGAARRVSRPVPAGGPDREPLALGERVIASRPHPQSGLYVLLGRSGFTSAFVLTAWLTMLYLFAPLHTSPFIYFQF
jgi:alginate O-acetyltransferase complex protein AlgI